MHLNASGFSGSKVTRIKPCEHCDVMNHGQKKQHFYGVIYLVFSRLLWTFIYNVHVLLFLFVLDTAECKYPEGILEIY